MVAVVVPVVVQIVAQRRDVEAQGLGGPVKDRTGFGMLRDKVGGHAHPLRALSGKYDGKFSHLQHSKRVPFLEGGLSTEPPRRSVHDGKG